MPRGRKIELGLVKGEERSLPSLESVREIVADLGTTERETVLNETAEFFRARQSGMLSYLSMGEHLARVRDVLEPHELWKRYAGTLPNMGIATAYRMIWAWENAQRALPVGTLRVVARDGYRLIANEKGKDFAPGYEQAVKAVTKEIGPAPEKEKEAVNWLRAVVQKKRQLTKPVDAHRRFSMNRHVKKVVGTVRVMISRLPQERRGEFLNRLITELAAIPGSKKSPQSVAA